MLNCLDHVQMGLLQPSTFQKAEITRRTLNFSLSNVAVVEPVFTSAIFSLDIDATGRYLLSGCGDGSWYIHDTFNLSGQVDHKKLCVTQCPRRIGHASSINTVEWYPADNGLFVTSSSDGTLCLWDANSSSKPVDKYDLEELVTRHQINPSSGTLIAACSGGEVHLIDIRTGTAIQKLPETLTVNKEVCWNPANQYQLLVGTEEGNLIEWDVRSTLTYRGYGLLEIRVARRGVRTRNFKEQVGLLQKAHDGAICSIKYRKDGMEFYSFGEDGKIRRWLAQSSPVSEPLISTLKYGRKSKGHGNFQMGLSGDTDPPLIFAPKGASISVCDMSSCIVQKELVGHFKNVNCFVYDDKYQAGYSGGNDSAVMVWSGHLVSEQAYQQEKISNAVASGRHGRQPRTSQNRTTLNQQLINLIDDDDFEEYEPPASPAEEGESS